MKIEEEKRRRQTKGQCSGGGQQLAINSSNERDIPGQRFCRRGQVRTLQIEAVGNDECLNARGSAVYYSFAGLFLFMRILIDLPFVLFILYTLFSVNWDKERDFVLFFFWLLLFCHCSVRTM